jgi:hypothetical protein
MRIPPSDIVIQEVAPRDGPQIEPKWVATDAKIRLIDSLSAAGFLQRLIRLSNRLPGLVGHDVWGQVAKAGRPLDLHPVPERLRRSV